MDLCPSSVAMVYHVYCRDVRSWVHLPGLRRAKGLKGLAPIRLAQHVLDVVPAFCREHRDHGTAGLPAWLGGVSGLVRVRRGVSALPHGLPLARGVPLPGVRRRRQLPSVGPQSAAVPGLPAPDLDHGRPIAAFQSLLGLTTQHTPTTYQMLYAAEPTG